MKTITIRLYDLEFDILKKIQDHIQEQVGKGIKITQSDAIRTCISEFYYNNYNTTK